MRRVDPLGLYAWDEAKPAIKGMLVAAARLSPAVAGKESKHLNAEEITGIATAAARLAWQAAAIEAMAPMASPELAPKRRAGSTPFPELLA